MAQIDVIIEGLEAVVEREIIRITLDITASLIETTPVDTGWARANWVPYIGQPVNRPTPPRGNEGAARASQVGGQAEVLSYDLRQGAVTISNGVPYIVDLNRGSSTQAPAGFVEAAIAKAVR